MEQASDKKMIFVTIASKGNGRDESEIRQAWERALTGVIAPGIENIEKITILPVPPSKQDEERPPDATSPREISLTISEEKACPRFYYTLDEKRWWEISGELTKVWQLRFMPRDIGITEGVVKVKAELGDKRVEGLVRIRSAQKHVLELVEP